MCIAIQYTNVIIIYYNDLKEFHIFQYILLVLKSLSWYRYKVFNTDCDIPIPST